MRRFLIISAIIVGIGVASFWGNAEQSRGNATGSTTEIQTPHDKVPAPDFMLKDIHGRSITLSKYRGKVVMLNFWTTWCPHCRAEVPSIEKLYRRMLGKDFVLLTVTAEDNGQNAVAAFAKKTPISFPVLLDPDHHVADLYHVRGIPQTYIIDKKGIIVQSDIGGMDWDSEHAVTFLSWLMKGERTDAR